MWYKVIGCVAKCFTLEPKPCVHPSSQASCVMADDLLRTSVSPSCKQRIVKAPTLSILTMILNLFGGALLPSEDTGNV